MRKELGDSGSEFRVCRDDQQPCKTVLSDGRTSGGIDIRRAEEARDRAEEQLRQQQSIVEYHRSQAALARAMTRLRVTKELK